MIYEGLGMSPDNTKRGQRMNLSWLQDPFRDFRTHEFIHPFVQVL